MGWHVNNVPVIDLAGSQTGTNLCNDEPIEAAGPTVVAIEMNGLSPMVISADMMSEARLEMEKPWTTIATAAIISCCSTKNFSTGHMTYTNIGLTRDHASNCKLNHVIPKDNKIQEVPNMYCKILAQIIYKKENISNIAKIQYTTVFADKGIIFNFIHYLLTVMHFRQSLFEPTVANGKGD